MLYIVSYLFNSVSCSATGRFIYGIGVYICIPYTAHTSCIMETEACYTALFYLTQDLLSLELLGLGELALGKACSLQL